MPDDSRLKSSDFSSGIHALIADGDAASIKTDAAKRGYLRETFRVFRLSDPVFSPIPVHYHDFHKIILFLSGDSGYAIEGKTWRLAPRDIIFVRAGEIHRPLPALGAPYERIVIYLAPELLSRYQRDGDNLAACFSPELRSSSVMHLPPGKTHDLLFHMEKLELGTSAAAISDEKIEELLTYINDHLTEPLTIDRLAAAAYVSRSYLMHRFKAATGYGVRQYVTSKRLLLARARLLDKPSIPISEIARRIIPADETRKKLDKTEFLCNNIV